MGIPMFRATHMGIDHDAESNDAKIIWELRPRQLAACFICPVLFRRAAYFGRHRMSVSAPERPRSMLPAPQTGRLPGPTCATGLLQPVVIG
jgi:hypothetical protein